MKTFGLIDEAVRDARAYILGASKMPWIEYLESGDWRPYAPKYEPQSDKYETNCCTCWGGQNQIETFYKFLYGEEPNYSEVFNSVLTPINPASGASPHNTYESFRRDGLIDNRLLPVPDTKEEFWDRSNITGSLLAKGQNWLVRHDFMYEWLWNGTAPKNATELLREALKTCPLGVSVSAWTRNGSGEYIDNGMRNNHWVILLYIYPDGRKIIMDSYDHSMKTLTADHAINYVKRIWVNKKTKSASKRHVLILQSILKKLLMKPSFLDVCTAHLGVDVTPEDRIADEVACAITVTTLLKKVYPDVPLIDGTWTLYDYMRKPTSNFIQLQEPEARCIAIAPTGTGKRNTVGHVWVVMDDGTWASNNSYGVYAGKFTKNYTHETAKKKYTDVQGMPLYFYKHV